MSRLIQKSGYIKSGSAKRYMKYIATREGVEIIQGDDPVTENQQKLIHDLLQDFPEERKSFEYQDYLASPTLRSASAFISSAIDSNAHTMQDRDIYMRYIATRPRVEKHGEHGLFSSAPDVDLAQALAELEKHEGNVWTFIFSLRREDASRLGYDSAASWRSLLMLHRTKIAGALGISAENFHWYAAFHDEGSHPHVHMMVWSDDPKQGFLTTDGIETMRSKLTNTIFKDELQNLYVRKDISYKELTAQAQSAMAELIQKMQSHTYTSPVIEQKMHELVLALGSAKGKKQYGYLKKETKELVDSIVDELAAQPEVAECYAVWNRLRDELEAYYKDKPREHLPLSQQKEFRVIKNMVIREAENIRLGVYTFEDEQMNDELVSYEMPKLPSIPLAKQETNFNREDFLIDYWKNKWRQGHPWAAHLLGKLYRDGVEIPQDLQEAERWFRISAEAGNEVSEYALGKLLLEQGRTAEALDCLDRAAEHGNSYAMYCLGKLCIAGETVEKDIDTAMAYFTDAAEHGNQYAQYALGKLYLQGREILRDREKALRWLELSAAQGNNYAEYLLDRADEYRDPSIMLSATKLLHHMSRIFQTNSVPPANPQGICMDSKRRKQLLEKRLALGHKIDDHEEKVQIHM